MDARRNAVLLGLLRERSGTLSDFVRALETLVRARVCLDVLSKAVSWISLVAIVLIVIREFAKNALYSPIEETLDAIKYGLRLGLIVPQTKWIIR